MAKEYKWSTRVSFDNDTPALSTGVIGGDTNWHTTSSLSGNADAVYYYHDANWPSSGPWTDANSSRVDTKVTDTWTASIDSLNVLTITVQTKINYIERTNLQGTNTNTPNRSIEAFNAAGSRVFGPYIDSNLTSAHNISGEINLGTQTIVLNPGESAERSTVSLHNQTVGLPSYDDIKIGVRFQNPLPLPTTYRLTYDANGGSGAPAAQTTTTADSSVTFTVSSTAPTWGYYRFLGWSRVRHEESCTDADVEYRAGDTITLQESSPTLTLYAVWMKDYRPGTSLDTNTSVWKSHNRTNGACHVRTNSGWQECRTIGGEAGAKGNPPLILHAANADSWYNQKKLGKE